MDQIITPDCPECHGTGSIPWPDRPATDILSEYPCGACLKRWDDANPLPAPATDPRDAKIARLREQATQVREAFLRLRAAWRAHEDNDNFPGTLLWVHTAMALDKAFAAMDAALLADVGAR